MQTPCLGRFSFHLPFHHHQRPVLTHVRVVVRVFDWHFFFFLSRFHERMYEQLYVRSAHYHMPATSHLTHVPTATSYQLRPPTTPHTRRAIGPGKQKKMGAAHGRPTQAHKGPQHPTTTNKGQRRPTEAHSSPWKANTGPSTWQAGFVMARMGPNDARRVVWVLGMCFLDLFYSLILLFTSQGPRCVLNVFSGLFFRMGPNDTRHVVWVLGIFF